MQPHDIPIEPLTPIATAAIDRYRDHLGHFPHGANHAHKTVLGIQQAHWWKLTERGVLSRTLADLISTRLGYHPEQIWGNAWNTHYDPPTESQAA